MGALKDDCFEASQDLMALDQAVAILSADTVAITDVEEAPLKDCLGRILAEDLRSPNNVPPHDNSAVDGYAVYSSDLNPDAETQLPVTGRIAAGHPLDRAAKPGEA
ncbi:MAG: molybdopterin molybdenumtransferase MoeA, partial [Rhodospirillaceae bacterium]|nr:molybdopterin molybdenumtransferase MoeA [Rhodospirillaceae bacterium]